MAFPPIGTEFKSISTIKPRFGKAIRLLWNWLMFFELSRSIKNRRIKTVEIIVEEGPWQANKKSKVRELPYG
jgi:hypothetical protein